MSLLLRSLLVVLLLVAVAGCRQSNRSERAPAGSSTVPVSAPSPGPTSAPTPAPPLTMPSPSQTSTATIDGVALTWKLSSGSQSLDLWFRIENRSANRIYVCDRLLTMIKQDTWRAFAAASVHQISRDTAKLVVGTPPTDVPSYLVYPVAYAPVEPGATYEKTLPLGRPLKSYNPMGQQAPLSKNVNKAVLIVQSFAGEPPTWRDLTLESGGKVRVPEGFTPRDLQAGPLPLP